MSTNINTPEIRLNKRLALLLGISRREADDMIAQNRVQVNNAAAVLGKRILANDTITVDGNQIDAQKDYTYVVLNKPRGYVCSRRSQGDTPTIYELLPDKYHELKPVGRLDKDSSGILLLTNDGDFAHQMTHPSFRKRKVYEVTLDTPLQPLHRQMISDTGISLDDGSSKFELERIDEGNDTAWRVIMHEGRNRQIRRTFMAVGYEIIQLHRSQFGQFQTELALGAYDEIDDVSGKS